MGGVAIWGKQLTDAPYSWRTRSPFSDVQDRRVGDRSRDGKVGDKEVEFRVLSTSMGE